MMQEIIFHIGLPKTGSTAIQAFLAKNIDLLAENGISYPFINQSEKNSEIAEGNALHEFLRLAKKNAVKVSIKQRASTFFKEMVTNAIKESTHPKILISGEDLSSLSVLEEFKALSETHAVRIIAFVRDPYDIVMSSWKQQVKVFQEFRSFDAYAKNLLNFPERFSLRRLAQFLRAGLNVELLSYDACRTSLVASFLNALDIKVMTSATDDFIGITHNRSLSFEEAFLIVMASNYENLGLAPQLLTTFAERAAKFPDPVITEIDEQILDILQEDIKTLNTLLPPDQKIRTTARRGTQLSDFKISQENVNVLLQLMSDARANQTADQHQQSSVWLEMGLPSDFDPERYLLLNPDVERSGMSAGFHYLNHGQWEGRSYKRL